MKRNGNSLIIFALFTIILFGISCKKDIAKEPDNPVVTVDPLDTSKLNIPVSKGSIGLIIDVRPIVKFGYNVASVDISIGGALSKYSKKLTVDQFTNLAILDIPRESLSKQEVDEFIAGIKATITAFDKDNHEMAKVSEDNLPINNSNDPYVLKTKKPKLMPDLKIKEKVPYFIQEVPADKSEAGRVLEVPVDPGGGTLSLNTLYDMDDKEYQTFYFEKVDNDSTFFIKANYQGLYLDLHNYSLQSYTDKPPNLKENYKFILRQELDGNITIRPVNNKPLKAGTANQPYLYTNQGIPVRFRIVTADVQWNIQDLGVEYNAPILPPARLEFAFNHTLRNCSSAELNESVGVQKSRTTTYTVGSEESFQMTTSQEASIGVSSSVTASASFYGVGVEASVEVSSSYTYGTSMTQTKTRTFENSTTEEISISRVRDITLKPYTAVEVYDAVETYHDVRIPFIQKLRVGGEYDGKRLSGDEIVSQLLANQFGGVVTETGSNYVIISVRGAAHIDNFMKASTNANEIEGGCPGH